MIAGSDAGRLLLLGLALGLATGCGAGSLPGRAPGNSLVNASPQAMPAGSGPGIVALSRLAAEDSGEFKSQRLGSEFAADLPNNRCSPAAQTALFDPQWKADMPNALEDAAYCLYRLQMYAPDGEATLKLSWYYDPPNSGSCWVGIPDWSRQAWLWQELPDTNEIALGHPAAYSDADLHSYAVVMVLDHRASALESIGYGQEPPPPAQYNLFDPLYDYSAYLVDMDGNLVHEWTTTRLPATCSYLLEDGSLLRPGNVPNPAFHGAGCGGIIEKLDWDGNVVWSYTLSTSTRVMHHDIAPLPNGNILAIVWEKKTREELLQAGRRPNSMPPDSSMILDSIVEIEPSPEGEGQIVWEWHLWDHLIQDFDPTKDNFGVVSDHPGLVDVNYSIIFSEDFSHCNAVAYSAELDQIAMTANSLSEIWIVDHSTSTEEAASHAGGNCGRGGDLVYRWGNPAEYGLGTIEDRRLFGGHDVYWIPPGMPGAGHLLVFNNGTGRPDGDYSSIDEISTPVEPDGTYYLEPGFPYGPTQAEWSYSYSPPAEFYSSYISGAQRLPNGNTVVCSGADGWFFEVTPEGEKVWEYFCPYGSMGRHAVFRMTRLFGDYAGLANLPPESD